VYEPYEISDARQFKPASANPQGFFGTGGLQLNQDSEKTRFAPQNLTGWLIIDTRLAGCGRLYIFA